MIKKQFALPLEPAGRAGRIVIGPANEAALAALQAPGNWPFHTAILFGPARSGKSLLAGWFAAQGLGEAVDDAPSMDEDALFHRWNRAQASGTPLLLTAALQQGPAPEGVRLLGGCWPVRLPDLGSRLGAALILKIGEPDDTMLAELILAHAEARSLPLAEEAAFYLASRMERHHLDAERVVAVIDRLSLERKAPPAMG
ncbi:MAG TPA: ATPase, partial [Novosphingobium sp.]|nr:ATPase [Novosphingobium sp.]